MTDRERIRLESNRFTSLSAFGRELTHLLEHSDYYIEAIVSEEEIPRLSCELGTIRAIGRLKVTVLKEAA